MSIKSITASTLVAAIRQAAKFLPEVNPRAIEFVCHYVLGSQTPMTLTEEEVEATKADVIYAIKMGSPFGGYDESSGKGWVSCPDGDWLGHIYKGVVGGFCFQVTQETRWCDVNEEEYKVYICKCWDEWDFNPVSGAGGNGAARLAIPSSVPSSVLAAGRAAAKALGVKVSIDVNGVYVCEEDLVRFNDKHRFRTEWQFELSSWDLYEEVYWQQEEEEDDTDYYGCNAVGYSKSDVKPEPKDEHQFAEMRMVGDCGVGIVTHKGETFSCMIVHSAKPWRGYMPAEDIP